MSDAGREMGGGGRGWNGSAGTGDGAGRGMRLEEAAGDGGRRVSARWSAARQAPTNGLLRAARCLNVQCHLLS